MTENTIPGVADDDLRVAHEWAASIDPDVTGWTDDERAAARVILDLLPTPDLPTLADMTVEERLECQWMQADTEQWGRVIIVDPSRTHQIAALINREGMAYADNSTITPRPDLPRMEWPGEQKTSLTLPKPRTLADELRDEALKRRGHWNSAQLNFFADRVEALENERDTATDELKIGAEVTTDALDRRDELEADLAAARLVVDEQVSEIEWLRSRAIPDNWRVAEHSKYGRVIVTKFTPDSNGCVHFVNPTDKLVGGYDWHWRDPAELTFYDETPAAEPERIDPASCGQYDWYLVEVAGEEHHGIRIDPEDTEDEWSIISPTGRIAFRADSDIKVIRPLTPEEMDAR